MSSNKLHPIYVALDSHQYSRAVKLASALPPSNTLGQALLAHALLKSGATDKALAVIKGLLWFESQELEYELERLATTGKTTSSASSSSDSSAAGKAQQQHQPRSKKGGKNKRSHNRASAAEQPKTTTATPPQHQDLVYHLTTPLELPEGWDQVTTLPNKQVITDETTLDTLAVTLQAVRLYTCTFQLYASVTPPTLDTLLKTYTTGLRIMALFQKYNTKILETTLATMQVTALQLAKSSPDGVMKLWPAQTALFQLDCIDTNAISNNDDKIRQRLQMLPRLAESLAHKYKDINAEASLLYLATLDHENKYQDIIDYLQDNDDDETQSTLTTQQRLERLACAHEKLQQWESALCVYEMLLVEHADQWSYWKSLLHHAYRTGSVEAASHHVHDMLEKTRTGSESSKYPCRARNLILCELAAVRIRGVDDTNGDLDCGDEEHLKALETAIFNYGNQFGSRASCAYSDLAPYIELLVKASKKKEALLLEWANQMRLENRNATDRSMLRSYIFATLVAYKVISMISSDECDVADKWLPDWTELVTEWRASQELGTAKEGEDVQKENQPGDELVLLAVQNILFLNDTNDAQLIVAASLLEEALQNSPYNAYLKIAAIDVYSRLNAVQRAWEIFQALSIKYIQLDSCCYLILAKLVDGGLYNEAIQFSNELLRFHGSTARDTGDYSAQAMEHGTLSKANEFLTFQRTRMDASLSFLEAKGRIMDSAPLVFVNSKKQAIGMNYGINGGEADLERATAMVREAHNPFGAPNIVTIASSAEVDAGSFSDNRDVSVLSYEILRKSVVVPRSQLVEDSIRRGLLHGLLIRLALVIDASKAPKKGKVVKASEQLQARCASLLEAAEKTSQFLEANEDMDDTYKEFVEAMLVLCRVIAFVSAGMPLSDEPDTLANREQYATQQLESITIPDVTWSVPRVCCFLPDMLVPFTVMLRMTANLFALYGWGKRKCRTRASAGASAKVAKNLKTLVESMRQEIESLPETDEDRTSIANELLSNVNETERLHDASTESVCLRVSAARQLTSQRVVPFLDDILVDLDSFEIKEA